MFDFGSLFIVFLLHCLLLCFLAFDFPFFFIWFLKVLLSIKMSSFLSDCAIGLGGSDSGGSIEQPIMDRDVILIGGSSFKDTCLGASDSESSSSERIRASHQTGGGISRPRGRGRPSAVVREPILVTMILPPSAFGGVRRGICGGYVRMSPCVRRSQSVGSLPSTLAVASYEWVKEDILKYKYSLTSAANVATLQC